MQYVDPVVNVIYGTIGMVWGVFVKRPMMHLYLHGFPWQGRPSQDVCSQLTTVEAAFWKDPEHPERIVTCEELIQRRFDSLALSLTICCYFGVLLSFVGCVMFRWCILRPLGSELVRLIKSLRDPGGQKDKR